MAQRATLTALISLCFWHPAFGQPAPYSVSSKAQGASFDLVVTETKREPGKSFISVPGFHNRTAPGARWLMCAYTDLALKRGFSHWAVVYPPADSDELVVGFSNSDGASVREVLGSDYNQERIVGDRFMPIEIMMRMCGMRR